MIFLTTHFLHSPVTSSLYTPFSQPISVHSSLNVSDQVSHPHKTAPKVAVAHTAAFMLLRQNSRGQNGTRNSLNLTRSLISFNYTVLIRFRLEIFGKNQVFEGFISCRYINAIRRTAQVLCHICVIRTAIRRHS